MGFFNEGELQSLKIEKMILHVVGAGDFVAEKERKVEYEEFFLGRIRDVDISPVYSLEDDSRTKNTLERIAKNEIPFQEGAQDISQAFSLAHVGSSRDGAFFIFQLSCDDEKVCLFALIKYDYSEVLEQNDAVDGGLLRKIVKAFISDKKAIQKSAIFRVVGGRAESEISTNDRVKPSVDLSDYFERFLQARREKSDQELNNNVRDVLLEVFKECKDKLPGKSVPQAFNKAITLIRGRQEISEEVIAETVIIAAGNPDDESIVVDLQSLTARKIRKARLTGLKFKPDLNVLKAPAVRRIKTAEGAVVTFPDNLESVNVDDKADGSSTITIRTKRKTEDTLLS